MKKIFLFSVTLLLLIGFIFADIEWRAKIKSERGGKEGDIFITHLYAKGGNVREDFVEAKKEDFLRKVGTYWIYRRGTDTVLIVDPEEKAYFEMDMEKILQTTGVFAQFVKMNITNPKVEVSQLEPEVINSYKCNHILIKTSYDIEIKIAFIKSKSHMEQTQELWATNDIPLAELSSTFLNKSIKTGINELDEIIENEISAKKNVGFVLKSISTQKNTDKKGKTEVTTTEMSVSDISLKNIPSEMFEIPAGYR
ncbi:MAG: DUF4412 domain-containing protein, partial [Candidatus Aminicenantia bacterium]